MQLVKCSIGGGGRKSVSMSRFKGSIGFGQIVLNPNCIKPNMLLMPFVRKVISNFEVSDRSSNNYPFSAARHQLGLIRAIADGVPTPR